MMVLEKNITIAKWNNQCHLQEGMFSLINSIFSGTYFRTLTGREVKLFNRVLTVEYDISKPCSLHMLFEETFYTDDLHKYRIW